MSFAIDVVPANPNQISGYEGQMARDAVELVKKFGLDVNIKLPNGVVIKVDKYSYEYSIQTAIQQAILYGRPQQG